MMARMPELSLSEMSARLKPSSPAISSCVRMRAAPGSLDELGGVVDRAGVAGSLRGGGAFRLRPRLGGVGLERQAPFGGERVLIDGAVGGAHWTTISLNRTAVMRLGAIAVLTRRVSSSLRR